jgi:SAM-dependent methyltransferase
MKVAAPPTGTDAASLRHRAEELRPCCLPVATLGRATDADGKELWSASVLAAVPAAFRGDCDYVWGARGNEGFADELRRAHGFVKERECCCGVSFLAALDEDGALGAETAVDRVSGRLLSRDLIDSANELCFLEEELKLSEWPAGSTVLDIGAGYGRFCHRAKQALPHLTLVATDGVPESLARAEHYLSFRRAEVRVVPPAQLGAALAAVPPRLAVAIHSLPEMAAAAVRWWLDALARLGTRLLLVVSNAPALDAEDAALQLHMDSGASLLSLLEAAGWSLIVARPKYHHHSPLDAQGRWRHRQHGAMAYEECTHLLFERRAQPPRQLAPARQPPRCAPSCREGREGRVTTTPSPLPPGYCPLSHHHPLATAPYP